MASEYFYSFLIFWKFYSKNQIVKKISCKLNPKRHEENPVNITWRHVNEDFSYLFYSSIISWFTCNEPVMRVNLIDKREIVCSILVRRCDLSELCMGFVEPNINTSRYVYEGCTFSKIEVDKGLEKKNSITRFILMISKIHWNKNCSFVDGLCDN